MDDKYFDNFLGHKEFGPAFASAEVSDSRLLSFRGKLPNKLLEYWSLHGWCGYGDGLFWTVDPEQYQPVADAWLKGTSFEGTDLYYLIARTAFGELFLWGENTGPCIKILAPYAQIYPTDCAEELARRGMDVQMQRFFSTKNKDSLELTDDNEQPLFQRVLAKLGPLAPDEMYGFVPALALGGPNRLENLRKVKAVEHLVMLADLGERKIMADIVKLAKDKGLM